MEQNGGAAVPKIRVIDDCKVGGQTEHAATTFAHRPADLDQWVVLIRALATDFHEPLEALTFDFAPLTGRCRPTQPKQVNLSW